MDYTYSIDDDSVLLRIFSNLDLRGFLNVRRVCRRWYDVASDWSLWRRVELPGDNPLTVPELEEIMKMAGPHVRSMLIPFEYTGPIPKDTIQMCSSIKRNCQTLETLQIHFPHLYALYIQPGSVAATAIAHLPLSLTELSIHLSHPDSEYTSYSGFRPIMDSPHSVLLNLRTLKIESFLQDMGNLYVFYSFLFCLEGLFSKCETLTIVFRMSTIFPYNEGKLANSRALSTVCCAIGQIPQLKVCNLDLQLLHGPYQVREDDVLDGDDTDRFVFPGNPNRTYTLPRLIKRFPSVKFNIL